MPRPVLEILSQLNGGELLDEAADELSALVLAVDQTGKPGKLMLEITLRKATMSTMAATGKVKVMKPKEPVQETLLFPTPEGNLLAEDPRQSKLPLKSVEPPSAEAITGQGTRRA